MTNRTALTEALEAATAERRELEAAYKEAERELAKLQNTARANLAGAPTGQLKGIAAKAAKARVDAETQEVLLAELGERLEAAEAREAGLAAALRQYDRADAREQTVESAAAALETMRELHSRMETYHERHRDGGAVVIFPPDLNPHNLAMTIERAARALERERATIASLRRTTEGREVEL